MKTDAETYYAEQMVVFCIKTLTSLSDASTTEAHLENDKLAMRHLLTTIRNRGTVTGRNNEKGQRA